MNKAILMGRLTKHPELRQTQSGTSVCNFTLAVNRRFKNSQGERETDFLPCVAWRGTADFIAKYFRKGERMAVIGEIQTRSWEGDDGQKRFITEINVDEAHFADGKSSGNNRGSEDDFVDVEATPSLPFDL